MKGEINIRKDTPEIYNAEFLGHSKMLTVSTFNVTYFLSSWIEEEQDFLSEWYTSSQNS